MLDRMGDSIQPASDRERGSRCTRGIQWIAAVALAGGCGPTNSPEVAAWEVPPKNVLITLVDTWAAGHLATYGYERDTMPFFGRLAEESILFEDASSAAAYTLASVASIMTGSTTEVHQVSSVGQVLPTRLPVLAEVFQNDGFETVGVSSNAHISESFGYGRGFDAFHYVPVNLRNGGPMQVPESVLSGIEDFFETERTAPFFAYWHFLPPHAPYDPPPPFPDKYADYLPDTSVSRQMWKDSGRLRFWDYNQKEIQSLIDLYDSSLNYMDSVLERIYGELERSGALDETLWIVLSDHGEAFGEHKSLQHSSYVYQELIHVPLLMRFPGGGGSSPQGRQRISTPVSLVDLFPTLVDLYDLDAPPSPSGFSLLPLLRGEPWERPDPLFLNSTEHTSRVGLRSGSWKLVHDRSTDKFQLFDLKGDPRELQPVSGGPLLELQAELQARTALWDSGGEGNRVELGNDIEAHLREIGYVDELEQEENQTQQD